jgi:hypothetical protein
MIAAMTDSLHQINLRFAPEQDRLILRMRTVAGEEVSLALTRRFVRGLWPALLEALGRDPKVTAHAPTAGARQAVMAFRHESAVRAADFSKPYQVPAKPKTKVLPEPVAPKPGAGPDDAPAAAPTSASGPKVESGKADPAGAETPVLEDPPREASPMLVIGCQIKSTGDEHANLVFQTADQRAVTIGLNFDMLHGIGRLLQQAVATADWGMALEFADARSPEQAPAGPVH